MRRWNNTLSKSSEKRCRICAKSYVQARLSLNEMAAIVAPLTISHGRMENVSQDLARLIARYQWLQDELGKPGVVAGLSGTARIADAMNEVFLEIVKYPAEDPRISRRQIAFLLTVLAEHSGDVTTRNVLRDEILAHVTRLADLALSARNVAPILGGSRKPREKIPGGPRAR
jgi:hypothetical protein